MEFNKRFGRNENIVFREEDEGAFLFDPDTGDLKFMNLSGKEAFLMLDGEKDLEQITGHLLERYPQVEPERVRKDLEAFIKDLEENRFIRPVNEE
jgi:hypothetical protein